MSLKQRSTIIAGVIFIALGLLSGFISGYVVDMIGASGHLATIVLLSILFFAWAYVTKTPMTATVFVYFVLMGLGTTVVCSMVTDAIAITDALLQSFLFFGIFFVVLIFLGVKQRGMKK